MISKRITLTLMLLANAFLLGGFVAANAGEQKVYKCVKGDGSVVFLPTPCGKASHEVRVQVTPHVNTPGEDATSAKESTATPSDAVRAISDGVADSHCRDDARKLYIEPDTSAISRAQAEMRSIQNRQWVGGTPANRQMAALNDETHIASLRSLIATEESRADATRKDSRVRVDEALARCDKAKQEREATHAH